MQKTLDDIKNKYFDAIVKAIPEEATTLGPTPAGCPLSICGEDGPVAELAAHREVIGDLRGLSDSPQPQVLACEMMRRFAEFRLHLMDERREHLSDLELSLLPVASTLHAAARACDEANPQAWEGVVERAARIPEVLAARERALAVGVRQGLAAHPKLVQFFADKAIPWTVQSLEAIHAGSDLREVCARATAALKHHATWLLAEVLPANGTASALGPEEHALRRSLAWGLDTVTSEIEAEAEEAVKAAHAAVLQRAEVVAGGTVGDIGDARRLLHQLLAETMQPGEDLAGAYRAAMQRALVISEQDRLFAAVDEGSCCVELAHGRPWIGGAVNWPAPLFDLHAKARVLVSPDPSAHARVAVDNLAIHEGLPGHGLESLAFRRVFGANPSPVELLGVHDDLMQATKWVGPMLRIEGHAVYVEELLLDHGFHSPKGALFAEVCKAIRAARVIADLDLHVHGRSLEETAIRFAERSLFPKAWADAQAIRYLRVPLQAAAYHLGGREVRRSVAEAHAREPNLNLAHIHEKLFALGPVPPPIVRTIGGYAIS